MFSVIERSSLSLVLVCCYSNSFCTSMLGGLTDLSCVCRLLQEQMEQTLSDTQHRLSVKMNELHAAHQQIETLEQRLGECAAPGDAVWFCCCPFCPARLFVHLFSCNPVRGPESAPLQTQRGSGRPSGFSLCPGQRERRPAG